MVGIRYTLTQAGRLPPRVVQNYAGLGTFVHGLRVGADLPNEAIGRKAGR
jgi:hypothetical protein